MSVTLAAQLKADTSQPLRVLLLEPDVLRTQVLQEIARADAKGAARTARVFGHHSRVVGTGALARACESLESAFLRRDLKGACGHLLRVQDDWLRVRSALEPQPYRMAG